MKNVLIFIFIVLAVVSLYSFFDQYLSNGKFPDFLRMRASIFQQEADQAEVENTSQPSTSNTPTNNYSPSQNQPEIVPIPEPAPIIPTISPYIGKVEINRVQTANQYRPSLITLNIKPYKGEPINITDWTIKTRKGNFIIPKGIEKYQKNFPTRNIVIQESLYVYLIGDTNPLGLNKNFRTNKCFGYLSQSRDFYPYARSYCSRPKLEDVSHLNPYCQEYIIHQYGCKMPDYSDDFKISTDSQCVSYILDYFTYNGCYKKYFQDEDFLNNYWYIYPGKNIVQEYHDTIYLYDQYGLLIDKYSY